MFIDVYFFCFRLKVSFLEQISFKKSKLFVEVEIQNLDFFEYVKFDGNFYLFLFLDLEYCFWLNLVQKFKIVNLR